MARIGAMISSGKDSLYAMHMARQEGHEIVCIISVRSKNPDSYMFHTPNAHLVELQARAMDIPLLIHETAGEKEAELEDLQKAFIAAKDSFRIEGVVTGALFSEYQKSRIDRLCKETGLKSIAPLWHMDQEREVRAILHSGFKIVFTHVAAEGFDEGWLGKIITDKQVDDLVALHERNGINIAGEGGEYESLVLDCPMFFETIVIEESEIVRGKGTATLLVKKARLQPR